MAGVFADGREQERRDGHQREGDGGDRGDGPGAARRGRFVVDAGRAHHDQVRPGAGQLVDQRGLVGQRPRHPLARDLDGDRVAELAGRERAAQRGFGVADGGRGVGLPTLLAVIYYLGLASPQYDATATLAIESAAHERGARDAHVRDASLLADQLRSRTTLDTVDGKLALSRILPPGDLLVLDDIIGSGATLREAGRALHKQTRRSGALVPITLARVRRRLGAR